MILATILTKQDLLTQVRLERLVVLGRSRLTRPCLGSALQFQQDSFTIPERTLSCIASAGNTPTTTLPDQHLFFLRGRCCTDATADFHPYTAEILMKRFKYTSVDYVVYKQQTRRTSVDYVVYKQQTRRLQRCYLPWILPWPSSTFQSTDLLYQRGYSLVLRPLGILQQRRLIRYTDYSPYTVEEALSRRNPKLSSYTAEILLMRFNTRPQIMLFANNKLDDDADNKLDNPIKPQ